MINLKSSTIRQWSRLGQRGVYGQALLKLASEGNSSLFAISADLGNSSGLDRFKRDFASQFLNIGIAEQNMIGFASGLSTLSKNVFLSSFAPFITMRAAEQVRMNLAYMKSNVKIVSIGSGISMGYLGNSHFGLEDISIIRSMPNIPVYAPCDCLELFRILEYLSSYDGPAYLRLTGTSPSTSLLPDDYQFIPENIPILRDGNDLLVLSYGSILANIVSSVDTLNTHSICVANVPYLSASSQLVDLISKFNKILVIEEHFKTGALCSIVKEILVDYNFPSKNVVFHSLPNAYLSSGDYSDLLTVYNLDKNSIIQLLSTLSSV